MHKHFSFKGPPNFIDFECFIFQFGGSNLSVGLSGDGTEFWAPCDSVPPLIRGYGAWLIRLWPLPNSSIEQWRMVVIVTGYTLSVTSQFDNICSFVNKTFWRSLLTQHAYYSTVHALSLLVVVQCVTVMNILALQVRRPEQNTELNATTEQFIVAKNRQRV